MHDIKIIQSCINSWRIFPSYTVWN